MSILIVDTGKYQPDNMVHAFKVEFNTSTHLCFNAIEAIQYLESHIKNVEVIIFNTDCVLEIIQPVIKYISEKGPHIATLHLAQSHKTIPNIDYRLFKPLSIKDLLNGILISYQKHMDKMNEIILISANTLQNYDGKCKIITTLQPSQNELIKARGVMIDSTSIDIQLVDKIKKSLQGHLMSIALYGTESIVSRKLFSIVSDFYDEKKPLPNALNLYENTSSKFMTRKFMIQSAKLHMQSQEYKKTIKKLKNLISFEPRYSMAHTFLGNCYRKINNDENALKCFLTAIDFNPYNPENYLRILEIKPNHQETLLKARKYCPNVSTFQVKTELNKEENKLSMTETLHAKQ